MTDELWARIQSELSGRSADEAFDPTGDSKLSQAETFEDGLARVVSYHLSWGRYDEQSVRSIRDILNAQSHVSLAAAADLTAAFERDQACNSLAEVFLFRKGFQALSAYRVAHAALLMDREELSKAIQHRCNCVHGTDIHPRAEIEGGVVLDHGSSVIIGETSIIESECYIFHSVTLGSTGSGTGKRHPTVRRGAFLSAGATLIGDVEIGEGAVVAAGSVVVRAVPSKRLVGGIPARDLGEAPLLLPRVPKEGA